MYEIEGIHLSLDEARSELKKRWENVELRKAIEAELGENFMPMFREQPRADMASKFIASPDNGFVFFYQCAHYINAVPLVLEYSGDIFVSMNDEKKGLGRLRVVLEDGTRATVDIVDFHVNEKKKIGEVVTKSGEKLIDFHRKLMEISGYKIESPDATSVMFKNFGEGKPIDWYYPYLLHFVAHGVVFDNYEAFDDDEKGIAFLKEIIEPNIKKIEEKFGLKPMVIRMYPNPENQISEEDFYWWSYLPKVNEYIIDYANKNKLHFKKVG